MGRVKRGCRRTLQCLWSFTSGKSCNVLLPLVYGAHVHHRSALAWLEKGGRDEEFVLCRITQLGLLRLLNNPVVMGPDVQSGGDAWDKWKTLAADPRFRFEHEPPGFEPHLIALTAHSRCSPKLWQDAYLAAFAMAADLPLVTFDNRMRVHRDLRCLVLQPLPE